MRVFKTIGILLLVVIAVAMILMLIMPTKQHIERSITINAPASVVYEHLTRLENFNKWSVWNRNDSTIKNTITGTDGTLGAVNTWKGDPDLSGEGEMKITSLEINSEIEHEIKFNKPNAMNAKSEFDLLEENGKTRVTWQFDLLTPRPWNIFNLFNSMEKNMGKDFEEGLRNLKIAIETGDRPVKKTYQVAQMNFPSTNFATRRQRVKFAEIPSFFSMYMPLLYNAISRAGIAPGLPSGLYFEWDEKNQETDMAAAIPLMQGSSFENDTIQFLQVPASKAIYVDYYGAYDKSMDAYATMDEYIKTNNLKQKSPVIEQYITDPRMEIDTAKWLTKIIFLVE